MTNECPQSLSDFFDVFSSDEFLSAYKRLWDKRLENSAKLGEKERDEVAFAHWAINQDIQTFFIKPRDRAQVLIEKEVA